MTKDRCGGPLDGCGFGKESSTKNILDLVMWMRDIKSTMIKFKRRERIKKSGNQNIDFRVLIEALLLYGR